MFTILFSDCDPLFVCVYVCVYDNTSPYYSLFPPYCQNVFLFFFLSLKVRLVQILALSCGYNSEMGR